VPAASLLAAVVFLTTAAGAQSGRAARPAGARKRTRDAWSRARTTPRAAASMPVLRQPHDHHRDLRARLRAEVPPTPPAAIRIDTSWRRRHWSTPIAAPGILAGSQPAPPKLASLRCIL